MIGSNGMTGSPWGDTNILDRTWDTVAEKVRHSSGGISPIEWDEKHQMSGIENWCLGRKKKEEALPKTINTLSR